ncbi:DUF4906 domain-containing protein [Porphyromonas levii]|uniref:DUF4906 domain-containing protein n=1 Tax=Porphyromonas levii TaxID=28114 RepID=A0A4Y8WQE6_9PORP|nr:DUF4906 domain-containing protein [Porphyromonas levii]TFH94741.1 DUF4906 domain-containing protein [Porphyromonas levii]TFH95476.1 DUF4906 domain-containing protein [Porphyromonas levii]
MRVYFTYILSFLALVTIGSSCVNMRDGELTGDTEDWKISVNYSAALAIEEQPLRAAITDYEEHKVHNLYLFMVDGDGNILNRKFYNYTDLQNKKEYGGNSSDPTEGTVEISTTSALRKIYAIANVGDEFTPSILDITRTLLSDQEKVKDEKSLKSLFAQLSNNTVSRINGRLLMSGVTELDSAPAAKSTVDVELVRVAAKVQFTIKAGAGISFTPQSWTVHRVPKRVSVFPSSDLYGGVNGADDFFDITAPKVFEGDAEGGEAANSFVYYQLENIKPAKNTPANYKARELQIKRDLGNGKVENGAWVNAPDNGTYVVLTGRYQKSEKDGTETIAYVKYTIHLGYINGNAADFNCKRNTFYQYDITVKGVDDIIVEANATNHTHEPATGAEGQVSNGPRKLSFDSHFVQFVMKFEKNALKAVFDNEQDLSKLYIVNTPFGPKDIDWVEFYLNPTSAPSQVAAYPGRGHRDLRNVQQMFEYLKNNLSQTPFVRESDGSEYVYFTVFVNEYYYEDKDFWEFVNKPDRSMILLVGGKNYISHDTKSEYSETRYGIWQKSIKTGYPYGVSDALGFETLDESVGVEFKFDAKPTYYDWIGIEDGTGAGWRNPIGNSRNDGWFNSVMAWALTNGYGYRNHGKSVENPRDEKHWKTNSNNQKVRRWTNYVDTHSIVEADAVNRYKDGMCSEGWGTYQLVEDGQTDKKSNLVYKTLYSYNKARYACLSRNRDLNGDGFINKDEVRWYMPAVDQLTDIWQVSGALNREDQMYREPSFYKQAGRKSYVHYLSSSVTDRTSDIDWRNNLQVLWAEEGCSTSNLSNSMAWSKLEYRNHSNRCVRALNSSNTPDKVVSSPSHFDSSNRVISVLTNGTIDPNIYRDVNTDRLTGEYPPHSERSPFNRAASKFQVAKGFCTYMNGINKGFKWNERNNVSGCSSYTEDPDGRDRGTWRVPNQRELQLMAQYKLVGAYASQDYYNGAVDKQYLAKPLQVWSSTFYSNAAGTDLVNDPRAFIGTDRGVALQRQRNSFQDQHSQPTSPIPGFKLRCVRDYLQ